MVSVSTNSETTMRVKKLSCLFLSALAGGSLSMCGGRPLKGTTASSDAGQAGRDASGFETAVLSKKDSPPAETPTSNPGGKDAGPDNMVPGVPGSDASDNWTLPHSGGPVWRQSTIPYCYSQGVFFSDLWSDDRGVYAISDMESSLFFNNGTGWSKVAPQPTSLDFITGIPKGGPLVLYGQEGCGVYFFDGTSQSCVAAVPGVMKAFVVDAQRIFAIADDRLLSYNGSYFTQYGHALPAIPFPNEYQLWAGSDVVVVAAEAGKVYLYDDTSMDAQTLLIPDGKDATSVWGFARDDLWVGSSDGRLAHYDGSTWQIAQPAKGNCSTIAHMWGADHVLFFSTYSFVGRWSAGNFDTVLDGPCSQDVETPPGVFEQVIIETIWGNSPTELFIALYERKETVVSYEPDSVTISDVPPDSCGEARIYWFDGQRLGRL
jgi:hypothetical protein